MSVGRRFGLLLGLACLGCAGVRAAEVVFTNGKSLEIEAHRWEGTAIWLFLPGGGSLAVPAARIREIRVEGGVELPPPPAEPSPPKPALGDVEAGLMAQIEEVAGRHGVDPVLVRAIIQVESAWDPRAVSPKGAMGLMQLMPATAKARGVSDPFDPYQNLEAGTAELADHLKEASGELSMALAAYNAGAGAVGRYEGLPPYRETLGYVKRVLDLYFADTNAAPSR